MSEELLKCPNCQKKDWFLYYSQKEFALLRSPCGLIRTIVKRKNDFVSGKIYEYKSEANKHYRHQAKEFTQFAKSIIRFLDKKGGTLLDIGCGFGWVVKEAKDQGFNSTGIDSSHPYTEFGKKKLNVDLKNVSLKEFNTKKKYDTIILNHVLEHIVDLNKSLFKIHSLLVNKNAEFFIASPNINSLMFKIFKNKWYGLQPNQHVWQFSPESLGEILRVNNFKIKKIKTCNLNYEVKGLKGIIFSMLLFIAPKIGQGDQIFLIATKNEK